MVAETYESPGLNASTQLSLMKYGTVNKLPKIYSFYPKDNLIGKIPASTLFFLLTLFFASP